MILVDTGPIVAAATPTDDHHDACLAALSGLREPPLISPFCALEVCYFLALKATPAAEAAFVRSLAAGTFRLLDLTTADLERTAQLVEQYADLPLGAADASVIALAERLGIATVMTLDRRHFSVVRPRHVDVFDLIP